MARIYLCSGVSSISLKLSQVEVHNESSNLQVTNFNRGRALQEHNNHTLSLPTQAGRQVGIPSATVDGASFFSQPSYNLLFTMFPSLIGSLYQQQIVLRTICGTT